MGKRRLKSARFDCPCCGYRTLDERAAYDICILCWWEDDGQGDGDADAVRGGPNRGLSLSAARDNFRDHLTVYPLDGDTRVGGRDSPLETQAKRTIMSALDRLRAEGDGGPVAELWAEIEAAEAVLESETDRKIREYEAESSRGAG
jgi:hypothetical protein